jgi:hypothetical protein
MWFRKTTDPLGKLLFEKYGVHMLGRPRENVSVCDLFAVSDDTMAQTGSLAAFLKAPFAMPGVTKDEALIDIESTVSDAVSGSLGVGFLQGFLTLVGVGALTAVKPALEKSHDRALRFRFGGCTRDYVTDGYDLSYRLGDVAFDKDASVMKDDWRYYLATAVHHCTDLVFGLEEKNKTKVDLSASIAAMADAKASLSVDGNQQVTAHSNRRLAYGVELNELVYNAKRRRLELAEAAHYMHVRAADVADLPRAMVGSPDGPMTLTLAD